MRSQASSYSDLFNALLGDVQARGNYFGVSFIRLWKDVYLPFIFHEDGDEERRIPPSPPEGGDHCDVVVVVPPSAGLS